MRSTLPTRRLAAALLLPAALTACSFSAGTSVSESDVEEQLQQQIADSNPDVSVDGVDCPDALDGEVDATLECTATIDGTDYPVAITVTDVDGSDIGFDYEISEG